MNCQTCKEPMPPERKCKLCTDCKREQWRRYKAANPDKVREGKRRYKRHWRKTRPEAKRSENAAYRLTHLEHIKNLISEWHKTHPNKRREYDHRYRALKKGCKVSAADLALVVERAKGICAMCHTLVPKGYRHIDHIIPLDKGGPHTTENLQLLCYRCNCRKGAKLPEEVQSERWTRRKLKAEQPFLLNPNWLAA